MARADGAAGAARRPGRATCAGPNDPRYVAAADGSAAAAADYEAWRIWALDQAEAMDPLRNGAAPFARLPPLVDWTPPGR